MHGRRASRTRAVALAALAAFAAAAAAVESGQVLGDVTLRRIDGGTASVVERDANATALVFFKPQQERSLQTLASMARCQSQLPKKSIRWVGIVPGDTDVGEARAAVAASGMRLTALVDQGDAVYAQLGLRMHPGIAVVDRARRLVAFEPFQDRDYCEIVSARLLRVLGAISDADVAKAIAPARSGLPGEDPAGVARRHLALGRKLLEIKAYAQAHESARKATAIAPLAAAWTLEGRIFAAEGNCADALRAFETALRMDPEDRDAAAGRQGCGR